MTIASPNADHAPPEGDPQRSGRSSDRLIARLPSRWRWAAGSARLVMREPLDGLDRVRVRLRGHLEHPGRGDPVRTADEHWHEHLHADLGLPWPCAAMDGFTALWPEIADELRRRGLQLGRGSYGGWDDGDPALARAVWCLMCHLRPEKVVETGVARGVTSRFILQALTDVARGQLWSIDLPAMDPHLHAQIGVAVPPQLRGRWTYIRGTSRRCLPALLHRVGPIDLFVHDSSHTERNQAFELSQAWAAIDHGVIVADDIHASRAFRRFVSLHRTTSAYVVAADDGRALFGVILKR